ncbi:MAG: integrin alpha [Planctomycetota bacterium]
MVLRRILPLLCLAPMAAAQVTHYELEGPANFASFGWAVGGLRDLDGDGLPEFLVGAPGDSSTPATGRVTVHAGRDGAVLLTLHAGPGPFGSGHELGHSVAGLGDVNGDGLPDLVAGAPGDDHVTTNAGAAWVFSGSDGAPLYVLRPATSLNADCGNAVANAGDVDGDGRDDILVGAFQHDVHGRTRAGSAWVFSGRSGGILHSFHGADDYDQFGAGLTGLGDLDGDGRADFAIGAAEYPALTDALTGPGYVRVYSGALGTLLYELSGAATGDMFGATLARTADLDGDGINDLLIGARRHDPGFSSGAVFIHSGADGTLIRMLKPLQTDSTWFGTSVASAGDLDGDSLPEILIGAPGPLTFTEHPGRVHVFPGAPGPEICSFSTLGGVFGFSLTAPGDLDGDGITDFVTGRPLAAQSPGQTPGRLAVLSISAPKPASVTPGSVAAVGGGPLQISGTGLQLATSLQVGGQIVPKSEFLSQSNTLIVAPAPGAETLGLNELVVNNFAGTSDPLALNYVALTNPLLVTKLLASSAVPQIWTWGSPVGVAPPGGLTALLVSISGAGTVNVGGFPVLASGVLLWAGPTNPAGVAMLSLTVPASAAGLFFHSQGVFWNSGVVGSTNIAFSLVAN